MSKFTMRPFPNDNWTRVELYLRATGSLENGCGEITQEIIDLYIKKYEAGELPLPGPTTNLTELYRAAKDGRILTSNQIQAEFKKDKNSPSIHRGIYWWIRYELPEVPGWWILAIAFVLLVIGMSLTIIYKLS